MRKILVAASLLSLALGMVSAQAEHAPRTVEGTILLPTASTADGPVSRPQRCAWTAAELNGVFGYTVVLDEDEGDGAHTFNLTSAAGDPAVVFYTNLATCDTNAVTAAPPVANPGPEAGEIPGGATSAIIVIEGAPNATFTFVID